MAAVALGKKPTLDQMKTGLAGNLCRCTGYSAIYRSIEQATMALTAESAEHAESRNRNDRTTKSTKHQERSENRVMSTMSTATLQSSARMACTRSQAR